MTVHIYPLNDWIDHDINVPAHQCECRCEPRIDYVDPETGAPYSEPLVIHNAIDQRELTETEE